MPPTLNIAVPVPTRHPKIEDKIIKHPKIHRTQILIFIFKQNNMKTKYGFNLMNIEEFLQWFSNKRIARTILYLQQHHTFSPDYKLFKGNNHFELQKGMKNHHVHSNGWKDIGQHFTIFPDGMIMTGRDLESSPACIYNQNANSICIENLGNFDADQMTPEQRNAIVKVTAKICSKLAIPINTDKIVYHHWFRLSDGYRNNGAGGNKSCPGINFFGGNKVSDCKTNFLPLVLNELNGKNPTIGDLSIKYVSVLADTLNIRKQSNANAAKVTGRAPAKFGAILRVFEIQNGWYKISSSQQHWVMGKYTRDVIRAVVNTSTLNVRNQPSANGTKIGSVVKGEELFVYEERNGWCKICVEEKWVKKNFINL